MLQNVLTLEDEDRNIHSSQVLGTDNIESQILEELNPL